MLYRVFQVIAVVLVLAAGYFGLRYYRLAHDPLVAGVPVRENADGTIDFTMIGKGYKADSSTPDSIEWVVRLPKGFIHHEYGTQNVSVSGGGAQFSHSATHNLGYFLWLRISDLKQVSSLEYGADSISKDLDGFSLVLEAETDESTKLSAVGYLKMYCEENPGSQYGLTAYEANKAKGKDCFNSDDALILWSDKQKTKVDAMVNCPLNPKLKICRMVFYYGDRSLLGEINRADVPKLADLVPRIAVFLHNHTIIDRVYTGLPFVLGDKK